MSITLAKGRLSSNSDFGYGNLNCLSPNIHIVLTDPSLLKKGEEEASVAYYCWASSSSANYSHKWVQPFESPKFSFVPIPWLKLALSSLSNFFATISTIHIDFVWFSNHVLNRQIFSWHCSKRRVESACVWGLPKMEMMLETPPPIGPQKKQSNFLQLTLC